MFELKANTKPGRHPSFLLPLAALVGLVSLSSYLFALTPIPGHPFREVGDGIWAASGTTAFRTFTFPDATSTVLTTASLVGVSQGGTGASATATAFNTFTGLFAKGDLFVHNGLIHGRKSVGVNNRLFMASSSDALGVVWSSLSLSPAGINGSVQFNDSNFFGATTTFIASTTAPRLGLNGHLLLSTKLDTGTVASDTVRVYAQTIAGRSMIKERGRFGSSTVISPAFFDNAVFAIAASGGTSLSVIGNTATSAGTISHVISEPLGYMANQVTATAASSTAGTFSMTTPFRRGTVVGSNGFFFKARMAYVTATSSGHIAFVGFASGGGLLGATNLNPAGSYIGFQHSTQRADNSWKFMTKDGTTQTISGNLVPFMLNAVYDMYIYCPAYPNNQVVYYRVENLNTGAFFEGSTTSTLPAGGTDLRAGYAIGNTNVTGARNIRMKYVYVEADN